MLKGREKREVVFNKVFENKRWLGRFIKMVRIVFLVSV